MEDPSRFERPIKKQNLYTFGTESGKKKVKKDRKVVSACLVKDFFGRYRRGIVLPINFYSTFTISC